MTMQGITKLVIAKKVVTWTVSFGVGKIVRAVIDNNTDPVKTIDKIAIAAGSMALGGLVADLASDYTDAKIDALVDAVRKVLAELPEDPYKVVNEEGEPVAPVVDES